jgi:hypothetical protein
MRKTFPDDPSHRYHIQKSGRSNSKDIKCLATEVDETSGNMLHCTFCSRIDHFKKDIANGKMLQSEFIADDRDNSGSILHFLNHDPMPIPHIDDLSEESLRNDIMCFIGKHNISTEAAASE